MSWLEIGSYQGEKTIDPLRSQIKYNILNTRKIPTTARSSNISDLTQHHREEKSWCDSRESAEMKIVEEENEKFFWTKHKY